MKDGMLEDKMEMLKYILHDFLITQNINVNITYNDLGDTDDKYIMLIQIKDYAKIYFVNKQKLKDNLAIEIAKEILEQIKNDLKF